MLHQALDQAEERERAPRVVAVPAGVQGQADRPTALVRAKEHESRQVVKTIAVVQRLGG